MLDRSSETDGFPNCKFTVSHWLFWLSLEDALFGYVVALNSNSETIVYKGCQSRFLDRLKSSYPPTQKRLCCRKYRWASAVQPMPEKFHCRPRQSQSFSDQAPLFTTAAHMPPILLLTWGSDCCSQNLNRIQAHDARSAALFGEGT